MKLLSRRAAFKVQEVQPKTMESKLVQGLYFAGELLDIDALTGGYNLQLAWSTGSLVGIVLYKYLNSVTNTSPKRLAEES